MGNASHDGSYDIVITGVGGQGIVLAGEVIARGALAEGHQVVTFGDYGMARRGGAVSSFVRIGENVSAPDIPDGSADLLLGAEPIEAARNSIHVGTDGTLIVNSRIIHPPSSVTKKGRELLNTSEVEALLRKHFGNVFFLDATELASKVGAFTLNMVMVGAGSASEGFPLSADTLREVIESRLPPDMAKPNLEGFEMGRLKFTELRRDKNGGPSAAERRGTDDVHEGCSCQS